MSKSNSVKVCSKCRVEKPLTEYYKHKRLAQCKQCEGADTIVWKKLNKKNVAEINRRSNLKRNFGITTEQYEELLTKQEGKCYVCQKPPTAFAHRLAVDHDHVTHEIRGLLCFRCNKFVVGRHRSPDLLQRAANYLAKTHTGWFVPDRRKKRRKTRKKRR